MPDWRETPRDPDAFADAGHTALARSEGARRQAAARRAVVRARVIRWLQRRAASEMPWYRRIFVNESRLPVPEREVQIVLSAWLQTDMWWKGAIDDDRWYNGQATSYGLSAMTARDQRGRRDHRR